MELAEVLGGKLGDAGLRAGRVQAVAAGAEHGAAEIIAGAFEQLIPLGFDDGLLDFLFAVEFTFGERGMEQHIREDLEAGGKVVAQDFEAEPQRMVAAVVVDAAADGFDGGSDGLGVALAGSLEEHPGGQLAEAIVLEVFGEDTALEQGAELDEREAMVGFDEELEPVGSGDELGGVVGAFGRAAGSTRDSALGEERIER